jgi:trans-aconitate methyltransferase
MSRMKDRAREDWNPAVYGANARFVADLGTPVAELLDPRPGERILDLGCGDGALTAKLAQSGCSVVGVDASAPMVAAARSLGLDARHMSGDALTFDSEFDAVFSNAALHWMRGPDAVIDGVFRALRPGGRFVAEMGGHGNIDTIVRAIEATLRDHGLEMRNPWFFPTVDEYRRRLATRGFDVRYIEAFPRPTPLPGDIRGWLAAFGEPLLGHLSTAERERVTRDLLITLQPGLCDAGGRWVADYVRLRFAAHKPA